MKKFIKNNLKVFIAILITAIICISGTVYAAIKIQASAIEYNDTPLDEVLDDLYTTVDNSVLNQFTFNFCGIHNFNQNYGGSSMIKLNDFSNYKYFKFVNYYANEYVSSCIIRASVNNSSNVTLNANTEYELSSYIATWINLQKNNNNSNVDAKCCYDIMFYNK